MHMYRYVNKVLGSEYCILGVTLQNELVTISKRLKITLKQYENPLVPELDIHIKRDLRLRKNKIIADYLCRRKSQAKYCQRSGEVFLFYFSFIITNNILNFWRALRACGLFAGMMIISPVLSECFLPDIFISASPSTM
jgi:hypothetical protein